MGHRLSKIYTRTGDDGTTGLGDGSRVGKDDPRVEAFGAIDELNSQIGMLLSEALPSEIRDTLTTIQHRLFDLGAEVCIPGRASFSDDHATDLESALDSLNSSLEPLREFILPGGSRAAALCHVARSVCRRAERRLVGLSHQAKVLPPAIKYLNRLSDFLFVLARYLNRAQGIPDTLWQPVPKR